MTYSVIAKQIIRTGEQLQTVQVNCVMAAHWTGIHHRKFQVSILNSSQENLSYPIGLTAN